MAGIQLAIINNDLDKIFSDLGADKTIDRFINFVADSRSKSYDEINAIAGVEYGLQLQRKKIGLIDELGGIEDNQTCFQYGRRIRKL